MKVYKGWRIEALASGVYFSYRAHNAYDMVFADTFWGIRWQIRKVEKRRAKAARYNKEAAK